MRNDARSLRHPGARGSQWPGARPCAWRVLAWFSSLRPLPTSPMGANTTDPDALRQHAPVHLFSILIQNILYPHVGRMTHKCLDMNAEMENVSYLGYQFVR